MSSFGSRLNEAIKSLGRGGSVVYIPEGSSEAKKYDEATLRNQAKLYRGDPEVSSSIDFIADIAVGGGFEVFANPEYAEKSDGLTAKEFVEDKITHFGLRTIIPDVSRHLIGFGNSFCKIGNPERIEMLKIIPPGMVDDVDINKDFELNTLTLRGGEELSGDEVVWMSVNHCDDESPLGVGICKVLLTPMTTKEGIRPPFAEMKAQIQKAMMDQITMFSAPNQIWAFPGLRDDLLAQLNSRIQQLRYNKRITTNVDGKVVNAIPERMRGLEYYAEKLWDSFYLGLGTPYPKLVLGGQFTEASANVAAVIGERRIESLQNYLKWVIKEEFLDSWVKESGLDVKQAGVTLQWKQIRRPDPNVLLPLLVQVCQLGRDQNGDEYMSAREFREVLIDLGIPLERKITGEDETAVRKQSPEKKVKELQPIKSAKKKYEATPGVGEKPTI